MRRTCQATLLKCDNGDVEPLIVPLGIGVCKSEYEEGIDYTICDKPSVATTHRGVDLCAEHWDQNELQEKGQK